MEETDRTGKPRDVAVEEQRRNDEQRCNVVNEERFLADAVAPIKHILDRHIIDIVDTRQKQKYPCKMISPQILVNVHISVPVDTRDDERQNEYGVTVDPYIVGEVVVIVPIYILDYVLHLYFYGESSHAYINNSH